MVETNVGIMIPLCFLSFKPWVCTPKVSFYDKDQEIYMILRYSNRQLVAMAAILNIFFPPLGSLGTFRHGIKWAPKQLSWKFQLSTFFPGWHDFWANTPGLFRDTSMRHVKLAVWFTERKLKPLSINWSLAMHICVSARLSVVQEMKFYWNF